MIQEIDITPQRHYGKYFLATEADDEFPNSNVKFNTKIVTVKPKIRRSDYFKDEDFGYTDELPEEDNQEIPDETNNGDEINDQDTNQDMNTSDEANGQNNIPKEQDDQQDLNEPNVEIDGSDVTNDNDGTEDSPVLDEDPLVTQISDTNNDINNNEQNQFSNQMNNPDDGNVDAEINTDAPVDDGPVIDDSQIPTDDDGMNQPMDPNQPIGDGTQPMDPNATQKKKSGIEYDSTRKYVLFNKYLDLINACDNYIDKLSSNMNDNLNINILYHKTTNQIREIRDLLYDYVTIKFELSSYVQSLLFYQNSIVTIYKIFDNLDKFKKQITNKNK